MSKGDRRRHKFPPYLEVNRSSSTSADVVAEGVVREHDQEHDAIKAVVLPTPTSGSLKMVAPSDWASWRIRELRAKLATYQAHQAIHGEEVAMNIPVEITWRNMKKSTSVEALIHEKVEMLERVCRHLSGCRVALEKAQHKHAGVPFRVRIDLTVPPSHELAVRREPGEGRPHAHLAAIVRQAFAAARRQLVDLAEQQQGKVKAHPTQDVNGVVTRLLREQGYGFLKSLDGREVYFHWNSVLHGGFERLEVGTGVRYVEEKGDEGPQASSVQIVDKPGVRAAKGGRALKPPAG